MPTTATQPLTDTDKMPFGKHVGKAMGKIPAPYLMYLYNNGLTHPGVRGYINAHLAELEAADAYAKQLKQR